MSTATVASHRAARRHWARVLSVLVPADVWPADGRPGPQLTGQPTGQPVECAREIDAATGERLRAVTRGDGVLLHAVVVAAVSVCFAARGGSGSIPIAVPPVSAGAGPNVLPVLPVPIPVDAGRARREHLLATRAALLDAYAAADTDPGSLGEHEATLRAPTGRYPLAGWLVGNPAIHAEVPAGVTFDGTVTIDEDTLRISADGSAYRVEGIAYLADLVVAAITGILGQPDAPLRTLLPADPPPAPADRAVPSIAEQLRHTGDGTAVVADDAVLTYAQLTDRVDAVARAIAAESRGGTVGLSAGQTAATVIGALAALRAGVPYVVLPPDIADDGPGLKDRGITMCVDATRRRRPGGPASRTIDELAAAGGPELPGEIDEHGTAYFVYTSGSTGAAKAVTVTRANLAHSTHARTDVYGVRPQAFMLLSPLHFDSSVAGLYATLTTGGTLHIVAADRLAEPSALVAYIAEHDITATLGLPRVLEGVVRTGTPADLATLRLMIGAGEAFPAHLARLITGANPRIRVVNEYGPSEATVWATWHDVTGDETVVPIGRPVPGLSLRVLDAWGRPLPAGLVGELEIRGPQVAAGYAGAPELTAERFGADGPAYRTGDLGWAEPDGVFYYAGRGDDEIKIRGVRVSLRAVAAAFAEHGAVADAEAFLDGDRLTVAVVAAPGQNLDPERVRAAVARGLSAAAVPDRIVPIAAIPRLANGKLDKARLAAMTRPADTATGPRRSAADALERDMVELFGTTLGRDDLGVDDNFFSAGGDSIKAALLIAQLSRQLSTYMYVVALLDHPTPAALAEFLRTTYAGDVRRVYATDAPTATASAISTATADAATRLRALMTAGPDPRDTPAPQARIPRTVIVLGPPRSGTTLLRTILGGHPNVFSPPELELLQYGTLAQRRTALSGRSAFYQEGLVRAVMSLRDIDADAAGAFIDERADAGWTTARMHAWLAEHAGDRLLVDKTTAYGLDTRALARAEEIFDQPLYVHLTRHPGAAIASFTQARLDLVYLRTDHDFDAAQAAELVWRVSHENISGFLDGVDPARVHRVAFEDLVADPRAEAAALAGFLGVEFDPAMLDVYAERTDRMTDGIRDGGRMLGDIKFHEHAGIDATVADRWRDGDRIPPHALTVAVARELGYGPDGVLRTAPLSSSPRWDWLLEMMRPGTSMLNIPFVLRGDGPVDLRAAERALRTLARRHHAFRSVIETPTGSPVVRFVPNLAPAFRSEAVAFDDQDARIEELTYVPFVLDREAPLRLHVLTDADGFTLLFVMHHVAADAWSLRVIARDFLAAYDDWRHGRTPSAPALPRQAADVAADEAARPVPPDARSLLRDRLDGVDFALTLPPADRPDEGVVVCRRPLDPAVTAAIRAYAAARGSSLYRTLLAAFGVTLHTWTGCRDLVVGTPTLTRGPLDADVVGLFITTAIVRVDMRGEPTFDDIVNRLGPGVRDAMRDAALPFEDVVMSLADRVGRGNTMLPVMFSAQELGLRLAEAAPGLGLRHVPRTPAHAKFDVSMIVADEDGVLTVTAQLSPTRFAPADAARLVDEFENLVRALVDTPDRPALAAKDLP